MGLGWDALQVAIHNDPGGAVVLEVFIAATLGIMARLSDLATPVFFLHGSLYTPIGVYDVVFL